MKSSSALQINEDIKKNWEVVQQKLKETYGLDVYKSWIQNVEAKGIDFSSLILVVKTRFVRDWIVSHYADKILDHYQKLDNTVSRIQFEINEIFDEKRSGNILNFGSGTKSERLMIKSCILSSLFLDVLRSCTACKNSV
mgnify:CR=1 FL=1